MNEIQNSLFEAMKMFSTDGISKSDATRTIKCRVEEIVDAASGKYKVSYMDSSFEAILNSETVKYDIGENVYVVIPDGDFSQPKFILGSVSPTVSNYVGIGNTEEYYDISDNFINSSEEIKLSSYESTNIIYTDKVSKDAFAQYLEEYRTFAFKVDIKTDFELDQQKLGNYGIQITIPLLAAAADGNGQEKIKKSYVLDVGTIIGSPYLLEDWSPQSIYFNIDEQYTIDKDADITIQCFCYDFPIKKENENDETIYDIFFKNLSLKAVERIPEEAFTGYKLTLQSDSGQYFLKGGSPTKTLFPKLMVNGVDTNLYPNTPCYWFIEDATVNSEHEKYFSYGGNGWRCLNEKVLVGENPVYDENGEQTGVEEDWKYASDVQEFKLNASLIKYENRIKCVIIYDNKVISDEIKIKNLNSGIRIELIPTNGNNVFIKEAGNVDFLIRYFDDEKISVYNDEDEPIGTKDFISPENITRVRYALTRYDKYGKQINETGVFKAETTKVVEINGEKCFETRVTYPTNLVEGVNTIHCTVAKDGEIIGTERLVVSVSSNWNYRLVINGGNKIYKYDVDGDSPRIAEYDGPSSSKIEAIEPLSFQIIKQDGVELTEEEYYQCKYRWYIPVDSLFVLDNDNNLEQENGYYILSGTGNSTQIGYDIARRFDKNKANANIRLEVEFSKNLLDNIINIQFLKEGESGTNGTKYAAVLAANIGEGSYPYGVKGGKNNTTQKLHYIYDKTNKEWFYHNTEKDTLEEGIGSHGVLAKIYEDGEIITDSNRCKIEYTIFDEKVTNPCFIINNNNGLLSLKEEIELSSPTVNIIQAKITIDPGENQEAAAPVVVYAYYPIEVSIVENIALNVGKKVVAIPTIDGGFSEVLYATDGTNPKWDSAEPFYCDDTVLGSEKLQEYYSFTWSAEHHLKLMTQEIDAIARFRPDSKYDTGNSKNYVMATLEFNKDLDENLNKEKSKNEELIENYNNKINNIEKYKNILEPLLLDIGIYQKDENNKLIFQTYYYDRPIEIEKKANVNLERIFKARNELNDNIKKLSNQIEYLEKNLIKNGYNNENLELLKDLENIQNILNEFPEYLINLSTSNLPNEGKNFEFINLSSKDYSNLFDAPGGLIEEVKSDIRLINEYIASFNAKKNNLINLNEKGIYVKFFNELIADYLNVLKDKDNNFEDSLITDLRDKIYSLKKVFDFDLFKEELYFTGCILSNYYGSLTGSQAKKEEWQLEIDKYEAKNLEIDAILGTKGIIIQHIRPIVLTFNRYGMSNLNAWDGNKIYTGDNNEYLLAPQIGAGYKEKDDNSFTGMLMGIRKRNNFTDTGLFGYHKGKQSIFLNAKNGSAIFGKSGTGGQIIIDPTRVEEDENGIKIESPRAMLYSSGYWAEYDPETGLPVYSKGPSGEGMLIDLNKPSIKWGNGNFSVEHDGSFSFAQGRIKYDGDENLTFSNVNIKWAENVNPPKREEIDWLNIELNKLGTKIDKKVETFYQEDFPHINQIDTPQNDLFDSWVGDMWYKISTGETFIYQRLEKENEKYNYEWKFMDIPDAVFDSIDSKKTIFTELPKNYNINDMYILETERDVWEEGDILIAIAKGENQTNFNKNHWAKKDRYTDDTAANNAKTLAEQAQQYGEKLAKAIGGNTEIGEKYIISPFIGGGYLAIENENNKIVLDPLNINPEEDSIFLIKSNNKDIVNIDFNGNAKFEGNITTSSGRIADWIIDDKYGIYRQFSENAYDNDGQRIIRTIKTGMRTPTQIGTVGNPNADVFIVEVAEKPYFDTGSGTTYSYPFVISSDGAVTATKANISGTINANYGSIGGWTISEDLLYSDDSNPIIPAALDFSKPDVYPYPITPTGPVYKGVGLSTSKADGSLAFWAGGNLNNRDEARFKVYTNGIVSAQQAEVKRGYIGGFTLTETDLYNEKEIDITENNITYKTTIGAGMGMQGTSYAFWAGSSLDNHFNAPFRVGHDGSLYASRGNIANFTIFDGYLYNGINYDNATSCGISCGSALGGDDARIFWAGDQNFIVNINGQLTAKDAHISGNSTFAGTLSGVSGSFEEFNAGKSYFGKTHILIDADGKGQVRIGTPDYSGYEDITIKPLKSDGTSPGTSGIGNIGTPNNPWSIMHSHAFSQTSLRESKQDINIYNSEIAYEELKQLPIYTYFYKGSNYERKNLSLGTMIDYMPTETVQTTLDGASCFNTTSMMFWNIAACQVMQSKLESLIDKVNELEEKLRQKEENV